MVKFLTIGSSSRTTILVNSVLFSLVIVVFQIMILARTWSQGAVIIISLLLFVVIWIICWFPQISSRFQILSSRRSVTSGATTASSAVEATRSAWATTIAVLVVLLHLILLYITFSLAAVKFLATFVLACIRMILGPASSVARFLFGHLKHFIRLGSSAWPCSILEVSCSHSKSCLLLID